ncbi:hypothetical protein, partial [Yersinia pestis]
MYVQEVAFLDHQTSCWLKGYIMYNAFTTLLRPLHWHRMTLLALFISGFVVNPAMADTQYDS